MAFSTSTSPTPSFHIFGLGPMALGPDTFTAYFFAFTVPFASPRSSPLLGTRARTWISAGLSSFRVKVISLPSLDSMDCLTFPGTGIHRKSISFTSGFTVSFAFTSWPT